MREQNVLRRISFICHTAYCPFQYRANSAGISKAQFTTAFFARVNHNYSYKRRSERNFKHSRHKMNRNPPYTNHKPWTFELVDLNFCFLRDNWPLQRTQTLVEFACYWKPHYLVEFVLSIVIFGCFRIQSPFFTQDLLGSVACAHLVNLPRITAILDVVDEHIFSESQESQTGQSIPGKNKSGRPCWTYSYQTSSRSILNPLLWLIRKYFWPIRYGVLRISSVLVLFRSCNLFYCSELAAPESPKMAETWIDKRSLSHYQLNNNITVFK